MRSVCGEDWKRLRRKSDSVRVIARVKGRVSHVDREVPADADGFAKGPGVRGWQVPAFQRDGRPVTGPVSGHALAVPVGKRERCRRHASRGWRAAQLENSDVVGVGCCGLTGGNDDADHELGVAALDYLVRPKRLDHPFGHVWRSLELLKIVNVDWRTVPGQAESSRKKGERSAERGGEGSRSAEGS